MEVKERIEEIRKQLLVVNSKNHQYADQKEEAIWLLIKSYEQLEGVIREMSSPRFDTRELETF